MSLYCAQETLKACVIMVLNRCYTKIVCLSPSSHDPWLLNNHCLLGKYVVWMMSGGDGMV